MNSVIRPFAERVAARGRYGIDWANIIAICLPMILECFSGPEQLAAASKGLSPLQRMGLQLRCRREIARLESANKVRFRIGQRARAIADLAEAIEVELTDSSNSELMQGDGDGDGDVFGRAWEEALKLGGS